MKTRHVEPMVFLSAWLNDETDTVNAIRTATMKAEIGIDLIECVGVYQGHMESSFGVTLHNHNFKGLLNLARRFKQESILYRDESNECFLVYCDDERVEHIGKWSRVTKEQAERLGDYTYARVQGEDSYFVAVAS